MQIDRQVEVSVLMAAFNTAPYLLTALESISAQSFHAFELIVIDDGSTDGSRELLESYATREPRMRLVSRRNKGLIATRNELLALAQSPLIAWMDSDDVSFPNRLQIQKSHFDADPQLVCLGAFAQCVDPEGALLNLECYPTTHEEILLEQRRGGAMRFPTTMMRRDAALSVGGFREPFRIGEDFDLLLRLSEIGKMKNTSDTLYLYRQHLSSVCASLGPRWFAYRDEILKLADERRDSGLDRLQRGEAITISFTGGSDTARIEATTYQRWSQIGSNNGDWRLAMKYAIAAIKKKPLLLSGWKRLAKVFLQIR